MSRRCAWSLAALAVVIVSGCATPLEGLAAPLQPSRPLDRDVLPGLDRRALAAASQRLEARVVAGEADPSADAKAAAHAGRFGLIWANTLGPGAPFGVQCLAPMDGDPGDGPPLASATVFISDMIGDPSARNEGALVAYATAYNLALLAAPEFPYADICRPWRPEDRYRQLTVRRPSEWAVRDGSVARPISGLHEAARRGTRAELRRWIRPGEQLNAPDGFGLTPLAWAVAGGRMDVVRLLLAAGADPLAGRQGDGPYALRATALELAVAANRRDLYDIMATRAVLVRLNPWPKELVRAFATADWADLVARTLSEPHDDEVEAAVLEEAAGKPSSRSLQVVVRHQARAAKRLAAREAAKCWSQPLPADAEVHLLAMYEPGLKAERQGEAAATEVIVGATHRPVVLVLSSYATAEWRLTVRPGALIAGVLALSYDPPSPRVRGLPPGIPVLAADYDGHCTKLEPGPYAHAPGPDLEQLKARLGQYLGRSVTAAQFAYGARSFNVGDPAPAGVRR